jgi:predicted MPP superfamily phosphohydrolase
MNQTCQFTTHQSGFAAVDVRRMTGNGHISHGGLTAYTLAMFVLYLFVVFVAAVYILAGAVVLRLARQRKIWPVSVADRVILFLAAAGVVCMAYGRLIEPYWLDTSYVEIRSSKIPAGRRPVRIVHFSDLHSEARPRLERELVPAVAKERPDLIVFTGDALNYSAGLPLLREVMSALAKIAPTLAVRGNWDTHFSAHLDLFGQTGARELNGDVVRMEIAGTAVWIAGLAFDNAAALSDTVRSIPANEFSVLLYHLPDLMPEVAAERIDLYCAGHTHGGQVALPFYGAMITLAKFGKRYEAGLYHEGDTWLYVNRGIGMEGGPAPRVRFWSRPELTVIDIRPAA